MQAHKAHPCQFEDDCYRDTSGSFHTHFGLNLDKTVKHCKFFVCPVMSINLFFPG